MALAGTTGRRKRTPLLVEQRKILEDAFKSGSISSNKFIRGSKEVVKQKTERLEGVNTFAFMCLEPEDLEGLFNQVNEDHIPTGDCPYGDGYAAEKVYEVLKDEV